MPARGSPARAHHTPFHAALMQIIFASSPVSRDLCQCATTRVQHDWSPFRRPSMQQRHARSARSPPVWHNSYVLNPRRSLSPRFAPIHRWERLLHLPAGTPLLCEALPTSSITPSPSSGHPWTHQVPNSAMDLFPGSRSGRSYWGASLSPSPDFFSQLHRSHSPHTDDRTLPLLPNPRYY